ncbi:MAG: hypothetical protein JWN48_4687 [Myxococcaceae bacterium]|nr:hypothetical protein [Myxococcaceae bacterium]
MLQLAIPSSYYLLRDDPDDERFAWRMFSSVRLTRCEVSAFERGSEGVRRPIDLPRSLHASWIRSLERGRVRVVRQFLATRCAGPGVAGSGLDRHCKSPAGRPLATVQYQYDCATQRLEGEP